MDNNDKAAQEMTEFVLNVYKYAVDNKMDITSREDVTKILETLKPDKTNVDIDVLIQGLVALDKMTKEEAAKRKPKMPN